MYFRRCPEFEIDTIFNYHGAEIPSSVCGTKPYIDALASLKLIEPSEPTLDSLFGNISAKYVDQNKSKIFAGFKVSIGMQ